MTENKPAPPKDASAIILVNEDLTKILWARRNPKMRFMGGYHSFTGGKLDESDYKTKVTNCGKPEDAPLISCAVRETFEEVGVLLVRNGNTLTKGQIVSLHDDLISARSSFDEILKNWGLWIDAEDFRYAGTWTTPEFSPIRFRTKFFLAKCPQKQIPRSATSEMEEVEFIEPNEAYDLWRRSKVLVAPPVLAPIRELKSGTADFEKSPKRLCKIAAEKDKNAKYIELNSRIICLPLRTKTLPPATHTNCFIVGSKRFIVIDAATPFPEEQQKLFNLIDQLIQNGGECQEIVVSHLHPDHFGGEGELKKYLLEKHNVDIPISSHKITAKSLKGKVEIEKFIEDKHTYILQDNRNDSFRFEVLHTPGHARGHLCFYDREFGFLLSSDNVVGLGTVVIASPEGNMSEYLGSLGRMKNLPDLNFLCGSHGSAVSNAKGKIQEYIDHRLKRETQIFDILAKGVSDISDIVRRVYVGLDPELLPLAKKSVEAHLEKLRSEKRI